MYAYIQYYYIVYYINDKYYFRINALITSATADETADGDIIIIDSLAGLVRKEYDIRTGRGVSDRYQFLSQISRKLKYDTIISAIIVWNLCE